MKKVTKVFVGALVLTVILIVALTGVAAAAGPYNEDCPRECECPNEDECQCNGKCQGDCECQCDGECQCDCECQSDAESLDVNKGSQTMAQNCVATHSQYRKNYQLGENGNCITNQYSNNHQYMNSVGNK